MGKPFVLGGTQFAGQYGQGFYGWISDVRIMSRTLQPREFLASFSLLGRQHVAIHCRQLDGDVLSHMGLVSFGPRIAVVDGLAETASARTSLS